MTVVPRPGTHFDEVDVAECFLTGGIRRGGVVRDEIAGLEPHLLEHQRVRRLRLVCIAAGADERDPLLLTTIHAIAEFERAHAEVIARARFDRDLFEGGHLGIASRLLDPHFRRTVLEDLDRVLHAAHDAPAVCGDQIDPVETAGREAEPAAELPAGIRVERDRAAVVENE